MPASKRAPARRARRPRVRAPRVRVRLIGLLVVMGLGFGAIGVRLIDLQAVGASHYQQLGLDQRVEVVELAAERGSIFDRNGNDLALSVPARTVVANPRVIADPERYASRLAEILGVDAEALRERLADHDKAFAYVARQVEEPLVRRVLALDLPGISTIPESKRYYPSGTLAAPVIGFVGTDGDGLAGLEYAYEDSLRGSAGAVELERDPRGRDIPDGQRRRRPATRGQDLVLTLDQSLQHEAERAVLDIVDAGRAQGAVAIIVDVQTGDVLAMAQADGAGDDTPAHIGTNDETNRSLTAIYEPGSTNKVITMAAALEAGIVTPDTEIEVPYSMLVGDQTFTDSHEHETEVMTVADILVKSSNIGTIKIAQEVGPRGLDTMLRGFGFGIPTAIEFPGQEPGTVTRPEQYSESDIGAIPIGQGIAVTAMQMLDVYTTIANDGRSRPPRLVAATIDEEGERHENERAPGQRVISPTTAEQIRTMLAGVVDDGTGTRARIPGYTVAGKTGTALKAPYERGEYVASFVGFAPAESPRFAAIVVVDTPGPGEYYGGEIAAPAFARILRYALRRANVAPSAPIGG